MHVRRHFATALFIVGWSMGYSSTPAPAVAQEATEEPSSELSQAGALVDFARDVYPIFAEKCLECHGPDDAKNDFRVDDEETLLAYVEPGDVESSSLWADYLLTDDPDMRMPPPDDPSKALTGVQLATIKLWIEEGAKWSEPPTTATVDVVAIEIEPIAVAPPSLAYGMWIFQGLFHPATIHFPIALLTVSSGFVLLSFLRKKTCEPVAYHCLWIGALGAILACVSGWSYAGHEGYGAGFSLDLQNRAIDRHRWLGIAVAIVALILVPLASSVRRTGDLRLRFMWLLGSLLLVVGVSLVGYQGGELTYGEDHYWKEYERLFPQPAVEEIDPEVVVTEATVDAETEEPTPTAPAEEKEPASSAVNPAEDGSQESPAASEPQSEIEASSDAPPPGNAPPQDTPSAADAAAESPAEPKEEPAEPKEEPAEPKEEPAEPDVSEPSPSDTAAPGEPSA